MSPLVASFACSKQGAPAEAELLESAEEWKLHQPVHEIDKKDVNSPDDWVPRHPDLIRLTGRHPLNCEPPLNALMQHGFITPVSLHYVRNHGPAPRLDWSSHRVTIQGLVAQTVTLTMDDILQLPSITVPVTLTCAGNRRKEENALKKSKGFSWGPGAVSNTFWTGVRLSDVLKLAQPAPEASYVCFNGVAKELPKGKDGTYGTSVLLNYAMDEANDVLLAYKQNGRWLTPDHGFPIRMIIPGFIGGRMVKWLTTIEVTAQESDNHYHYFDNRVLPPHVDEELASKEGWWYRPDYIINELNIQSVIAKPEHDELLPLDVNQPYTLSGYAYSGGGRKVIRVEVSLDDGASWEQAEIIRFETPNKYGKYWCWVHWKLPVPTAALLASKELLVRAWDSSQNGQPATLTWNVMGMMNNCYYRVKTLPCTDTDGKLCLRFQHPAPALPSSSGLLGWREEANTLTASVTASVPAVSVPSAKAAAAGMPANSAHNAPEPAATANGVTKAHAASANGYERIYTIEEVAEHDSEESCWFIHEGKVYDATPFLEEHPGGAESILLNGGQDATDEFNSIHSLNARSMLAQYCIGRVGTQADKDKSRSSAHGTRPSTLYANGNGAALHMNGNGAALHANGNGAALHVNGNGAALHMNGNGAALHANGNGAALHMNGNGAALHANGNGAALHMNGNGAALHANGNGAALHMNGNGAALHANGNGAALHMIGNGAALHMNGNGAALHANGNGAALHMNGNGAALHMNGNGGALHANDNGAAPTSGAVVDTPSADLVALNPKKRISCKLQEKRALSHNTYLFRFGLQSPRHRFGLPVGKHVYLYAKVNGETVVRAYTPTSSDDDLGHFDLVVKIYRAHEHPKFPDGGKMSQHLEQLPVGGSIEVKGPVGDFVYLGEGRYMHRGHAGFAKCMNFIAGGTGLTPCYAVIKAALRNKSDKTQLRLLYANNTPDDILLRDELDALAAQHSNFKVWYSVTSAPEGWQFSTGHVDLEMMHEQLLPAVPGESLALICGPPPMLEFACKPNLQKMGFTSDMVVIF